MGCLALAVLAAACGKKKDASDGGADGGDEASTAAADAGGEVVPSNATGVARFGDENKLDGSSVALSFATPVHAEPGTGAVVATLAKGTQVTLVAEHGTATIITFPDPKNASSTRKTSSIVVGSKRALTSGGAASTGASIRWQNSTN
jgi:hypothetical protein